MDDSQGGSTRTRATEELILRTIAAHADSLLRTARRHSMCADDAQDAYQRAIEIFMGHAHRLDGARAAGWLLSTQAGICHWRRLSVTNWHWGGLVGTGWPLQQGAARAWGVLDILLRSSCAGSYGPGAGCPSLQGSAERPVSGPAWSGDGSSRWHA